MLFNKQHIMKTLNIDTLEVSGTGNLVITEGEDNTLVKNFIGVKINSIHLKAVAILESPLKPTMPGELKRILMLMHLLRYGANPSELIYSIGFRKKVYMTLYQGGLSFKISLSTKKNKLILKSMVFPNNCVLEHGIDEYMAHKTTVIEEVKSYIDRANAVIEKLFNKY